MPPLPLDRFSPRAQPFLLRAERCEVERNPAKIARRLAACGRPVFPAANDFERTFGGLSSGEGADSNYLAIQYGKPKRLRRGPPDRETELGLVPIRIGRGR